MVKVVLPELGEGIKVATVSFWHFNEGDKVKKGEDLVELVTDKATFNVSAEKAGVLKKILIVEGKEANIGDVLAMLE